MGSAKEILVRPVSPRLASALVRRVHYSHACVSNSQLHIGVFYRGRLDGAMQFGPPLCRRNVLPLVRGTPWNGMIELNRLAFSESLPRNSESRALGIVLRMLRKRKPSLQWVLSYADGTQCGDGTIYRAAGFVLTGIKRNSAIWAAPDGQRFTDVGLRTGRQQAAKARRILNKTTVTTAGRRPGGGASMRPYREAGWRPLPGFQLRYIYFLDPAARKRLAVPILAFSAIDEAGARMYRGMKGAGSADSGTPGDQPGGGGVSPTSALH